MRQIRFTTNNAYGEFSFYATEEQVQEFLIQTRTRLSVANFEFYCTSSQARSLFDWIKTKNSENKNPTNS